METVRLRDFLIYNFQSLPKTSYYKLIDTWLLVSLNILVVTMLFHTFLAHVVSKATQKPVRLFSAKSAFNRVKAENSVTMVSSSEQEQGGRTVRNSVNYGRMSSQYLGDDDVLIGARYNR